MNLHNVLLFNTLLPAAVSRTPAGAARLPPGARSSDPVVAAAAPPGLQFRSRLNTEPRIPVRGAQSVHRRRAPATSDGATGGGVCAPGRRWSASAMPRSLSEPIGPIAELPEPDAPAATCAPPQAPEPPPRSPVAASRPPLCPQRIRAATDRSRRVRALHSHCALRSLCAIFNSIRIDSTRVARIRAHIRFESDS